jgi:hypothetical protein
MPSWACRLCSVGLVHAGSSIAGCGLTFSPLGRHAGLAGCARHGGSLVRRHFHLAVFLADFSTLDIDPCRLLMALRHSMELSTQFFVVRHPRRLHGP